MLLHLLLSMPFHCPYCQLSALQSSGEVYCSRHSANIAAPDNGIFIIRGQDIESGEHYSRFAIRFIAKGRMQYRLDGKDYRFAQPAVLQFGHQSMYELIVPKQREESLQAGIAYRPSFIAGAASPGKNEWTDLAKELNGPQENTGIGSGNTVLPFGKEAAFWMRSLLQLADQPADKLQRDDIAFRIFEWYRGEACRMNKLDGRLSQIKKASTRQELLQRLEAAREMIIHDAECNSVEELARAAALSEYHFIRLYRQLYQQSPYQHLLSEKMKRAYSQLGKPGFSVQQAAMLAGYESAAAFSRQFRRCFGVSPRQVQQAVVPD